jgi:hypothetical protein
MQYLRTLAARRNAERRLDRSLTEEELSALEESDSRCVHCGGYHARACPRVKRLEFHQNGQPAAVEFWPPDVVSWVGVVFDDQGDPDEGSLIRVDDIAEDVELLISVLTGKDKLVGVRNAVRRHPARQYVAEAVHRIEALIEVARYGAVESPDAAVP